MALCHVSMVLPLLRSPKAKSLVTSMMKRVRVVCISLHHTIPKQFGASLIELESNSTKRDDKQARSIPQLALFSTKPTSLFHKRPKDHRCNRRRSFGRSLGAAESSALE